VKRLRRKKNPERNGKHGEKMKVFKLIRVVENEHGTYGVLIDEDTPICLTLERPWKNNKRNISCIPTEIYMCRRVNSPRFGNTFKVLNVPKRTHILFHKGNIAEGTHGCIIVGELFDPLGGEHAVLSSGKAFKEFKAILDGEHQFTLVISSS